ncbi:GNAT family N-acetyltransferase [Halalkalibacter kiskunsagensis]|uniref:GNAT family N-acetyltransferase n=1 Tax=Halalkalibacter kiskunsagensis TaxID=1548599 RepID=A0ABV6KE80_9BACI
MIIKKATKEEQQYIQSCAPIVQQEATVGYTSGNKLMITDEVHFFYNTEYFSLEDHGLLCGWILVGETRTPAEPDPIAMILELYVLPQYRKKGFGYILMNYAMDLFRHRKFKKVQLNVFAGNKAKLLYENLGFKEVSSLMERPL